MFTTPIPVLCFHHVDSSGGAFTTTPEVFESHMAWLEDEGFQTLTAAELATAITDESATVPGRPVVITFDDGFTSLDTEVAPVLRRHNFTACAFVITGRMGDVSEPANGSGAHGPPVLGWQEARSLATEGVLEFHSHTHSHEKWTFGHDEAATVAQEMATARSILAERLGEPESSFDQIAWPYGRTCDEWEDEANRLGIRTQYVVQRGAIDRRQTTRLPRMLADDMSPKAFARWMTILSDPSKARNTNRFFGAVRQVRQGAAYR